jgi:hypothetical protein
MQSNVHDSGGGDLSEELIRLGYEKLFRLPDSGQRIEGLWNRPNASGQLLQIALDENKPWLARFLATEISFQKEMFLIRPQHYASLAPVYAKAFFENASGFMSDWGLMINMQDVGKLGSRFVLFGRVADASLRPMLDDDREVPYVYPPDFPSQIQTGLRINDFVLLFLSTIHSIPVNITEDAAQRDEEIQRLKGLLP